MDLLVIAVLVAASVGPFRLRDDHVARGRPQAPGDGRPGPCRHQCGAAGGGRPAGAARLV
ncbi:hypothetical protein DSOL_5416 [Desulfosporosinus metallidurans]|uniref:Uncharacterized protein n=1 Tax=Desulfosporosinus metallidurans TaxID=1888891 RepID=A0A1Q8QBG2_9FIRM|nr:hypothetical protein DSOL_5416 [Desulfosporosinus metallidurans]